MKEVVNSSLSHKIALKCLLEHAPLVFVCIPLWANTYMRALEKWLNFHWCNVSSIAKVPSHGKQSTFSYQRIDHRDLLLRMWSEFGCENKLTLT